MRETVEAARRLLAMERVTYHGEFVHLDDVEIDIVHGDRSPKHVPIYVGATGMKMMELAGEIGDGVLLNYLVGPGYNRKAMEALAEGAARAGRTVDDLDRPQLVVCSLDDDRSLALDRARELVAQYLGQQPHIMKASGVDESLLEEIGRVLTWPATPEQIEQAMALVPDEVVQLITASGTPDECRAKVEEYVESGCTCPVLYPLGDDVAGDDRRLRGREGLMEVFTPTSFAEALDVKRAHPEALPVAGGTDLMVELNAGRLKPPALLDLSRIEKLKTWRRENGTVFLGAGMTFARIGDELGAFPPLVQAARAIGSRQIRNRATIGGNLATASPAGDGIAVLAAYDADVVLARSGSQRKLPWRDFLLAPKRTALEPDELIEGVEWHVARGPGSFVKLGPRGAMVISVASACLQLDENGGVRLALGSVAPTVVRCPEAEAYAAARPNPVEFGRRAAAEARPIDDLRGTAAYRRHAVEILARRALAQALEER